MKLSKANLKALYGASGSQFPDNVTQLITELVMRTFGEDLADSLLLEYDNTIWRDCGVWNFSTHSDLFPTTGGTGPSGAILKNNTFDISGGGSPAGMTEPIPTGAIIRAMQDNPTEASHWKVIVGII